MTCDGEYYEYWKGYPEELDVLVLICCLCILYGSIKVFACIKARDRPFFVTMLWIFGDITTVLGMISSITWNEGGYAEESNLAVYTFQAYVFFFVTTHYIFAREYFAAALNLPIVMVFSTET